MSEVVLPDLGGRTALVTGASGGVGLQIALALGGAGAALVLPVRSRARGDAAAERIGGAVELRDLDLSVPASVDALAAALVAERVPIDLLIANAGIVTLGDPVRHVAENGVELHLQTNFLGHFALIGGLLPLLRERRARVVLQLSYIAGLVGIDWTDLQSERRYSALRAYGVSKVALGLFGGELRRRADAGAWGITVQLCHPGIAPDTGIAPAVRAKASGGLAHAVTSRFGNSPAQAAQPALLAATTDAASGGFFGPSRLLGTSGPARVARPSPRITDPADAARIWAYAEETTGVRVG